MKNLMKKTIAALVCLMTVSTVAMADNDTPVTISQLPQTAQTTLKSYFKNKKVALSKMESGVFEKNYEVIFTTGEKIEFDRKGNWTEINCRNSAVPTQLVPKSITNHVKENYPGMKILEIEYDRKEYEVKLSNGIELTYNKKFQLIDIDD